MYYSAFLLLFLPVLLFLANASNALTNPTTYNNNNNKLPHFAADNDNDSSPSLLKGVIFDMDGTLIRPCIDFASMRVRIYKVASDDFGRTIQEGDVVTMVSKLSPKGQEKALLIFNDIEEQARRNMKLMPGMLELCQFLDEHDIPRAILTRNIQKSVEYLEETVMANEWQQCSNNTNTLLQPSQPLRPFSPKIARDTLHQDDGTIIPAKPFPDAIHYICSKSWNCVPSQVIMVGDSDKDDVVAGNRAGCGATVLLKQDGEELDNDSGNDGESLLEERQPTLVVESLAELQAILAATLQKND